MYIALGSGDKQIVFYSADKLGEVDSLMSRIITAYKAMFAIGHPSILNIERRSKLIFSSDRHIHAALNVCLSPRRCGIYVDRDTFHKQLARKLFTETGWDIYQTKSTDADLEIGIGGLNASTQGFVVLKDALLGLAVML